jgi:hypothetical protein
MKVIYLNRARISKDQRRDDLAQELQAKWNLQARRRVLKRIDRNNTTNNPDNGTTETTIRF